MSCALKKWAEGAVVHQVPRIKRAFVVEPKNDDEDVIIKTDGVNINAMFGFTDTLDMSRLYCNDIHAVVKHYGVEAASRVIVKVSREPFGCDWLQSTDFFNFAGGQQRLQGLRYHGGSPSFDFGGQFHDVRRRIPRFQPCRNVRLHFTAPTDDVRNGNGIFEKCSSSRSVFLFAL